MGTDRMACFGRELTKKIRGKSVAETLQELKTALETRSSVKGEFVLIVAGKDYTE